MSDEGGSAVLIGALIVAIISAVTVGLKTQQTCDGIWRDQLTASGHAEYFLDGNNQRQWRMKEAR